MSEADYEKCPQCGEIFTKGKNFCANCGVPIDSASGRVRALIDEALTTKFKDQRFVALETSVAAADKLTGWLKIFLYWAAIPLALIAVLLGVLGFRTYSDFGSKVAAAEAQVESVSRTAQTAAESARQKAIEVSQSVASLGQEVASSKDAVSTLQRTAVGVREQYGQLESDVGRYKEVNQRIEDVQRQLTDVKGQILDLGNRTLRVGTLETSGQAGVPSSFSFGSLGCSPSVLAAGHKVAYCTDGTLPSLFLFQRTVDGDLRPVASASPVGFQDMSRSPKPVCSAPSRGTLYVEKGSGIVGDKPFLCARVENGGYRWVQMAVLP